jgi:hypothetical protein
MTRSNLRERVRKADDELDRVFQRLNELVPEPTSLLVVPGSC